MKKVRIVLIILLAAILAGVLGYIVYRDMDRAAGAEIYTEAEALAGIPKLGGDAPLPASTPAPASGPSATAPSPTNPVPSESLPSSTQAPVVKEDPLPYFAALEDTDLEALRAYNPEVLGWIAIPGVLSYPLMHGQDNSFYLNHTWNGSRNSVGSVFMDYRCQGDMSDFNTVIYAHRTRQGAMFGSLSRYADPSFWAAHPDVYLVTDTGINRYRIYAAYEAKLTAPAYYRQFSTAEGRESFISDGIERSCISTDARPAAEDRFITLSTCTGNGHSTRWVVQAALTQG